MSGITAVHARFLSDKVDVLLWPLLAAPAVSLAALIGSAAILLLGKRAERANVWILSFAIGTLSGAATLHLLPEALETQPAEDVRMLFLGGIFLSYGPFAAGSRRSSRGWRPNNVA